MSKGKVWFALSLLFVINLLNFYDRIIPGAVGELIRKEWSLSDTQYGVMGTAFIILYALVGVPLGRFADKLNRAKILTIGVTAWSVLTALSGMAQNFGQMIGLRLAVGVGEAACAPAANSMIGDMFPPSKRARALSLFMLGLPLGNALGLLLSGLIAAQWGWRMAFYVAIVPGILCGIGAMFVDEPARGATEAAGIGGKKRPGNPFLIVLAIPTMLWLVAAGALHNFVMYAIGSFLIPFMMRYHELPLAKASNVSMAVYGLAGIPGMILGGWLGDIVIHRRRNGRLLVAAFAMTLAAPAIWFGLDQPPVTSWFAFSMLFGFGTMLLYVYYATVYSSIQDVIEPALRGTAMAIYFCFMYLFGGFLGPLGVGMISDHFAYREAAAAGIQVQVPSLFQQTLSLTGNALLPEGPETITDPAAIQKALEPFKSESLHKAMYSLAIASAALGIVLFAASATVGRDTDKLQKWMRDNADAPPHKPTPEKVGA